MGLVTRILKFIDNPRNARCTCCWRKYQDVQQLLVEAAWNVFICDTCIDRCRVLMDSEKMKRGIIPSDNALASHIEAVIQDLRNLQNAVSCPPATPDSPQS